MRLKKLSIINYKNISGKDFDFAPKINALVGNNGVGKTNVLDAIYHLAFGKSYFNGLTFTNIKSGEDFFVLDGFFEKDEREEHIVCGLKKQQRKIINRNGKAYERLSEHLGLISAVIISPTDTDLINEYSEIRRKWMDQIICESDKTYLHKLINYNKALEQRNALLKSFSGSQSFNPDFLDFYDRILIEEGIYIAQARANFIHRLNPILEAFYADISNSSEAVSLSYKSDFIEKAPKEVLSNSLQKDRQLQYTTKGTHKDDLLFLMSQQPIKQFASQGQQKSFLIALKLAQFSFIKEQCKHTPILLLDDIFDKLDEQRVSQLIHLVSSHQFGQIFISDTHPRRIESILEAVGLPFQIFLLQ